MEAMARTHDYPIIRFLIGAFYLSAGGMLAGGVAVGAYLWVRAEALRDGVIMGGPLSDGLIRYDAAALWLGASVAVAGGGVGFLLFGAIGQILSMQRDRAVHSARQIYLLEDILELNEDIANAPKVSRVDLCEGCRRLATLQRIDSGQWVCRECRQQIRTAS